MALSVARPVAATSPSFAVIVALPAPTTSMRPLMFLATVVSEETRVR